MNPINFLRRLNIMHDTALALGSLFFQAYARSSCTVVELGSMEVNGSLRTGCPPVARYIGLDVMSGPGVDIVVEPNARLPIATDFADLVVASSVFEHDLFFWETFLELIRITKPGGAIYINAPSNGRYHRHPADNWRFYPDSGKALEAWAKRNDITVTLVESFITERRGDAWNDFVAVFVKGDVPESNVCFLSEKFACTNVWRHDQIEPTRVREKSEDMVIIGRLRSRARRWRRLWLFKRSSSYS